MCQTRIIIKHEICRLAYFLPPILIAVLSFVDVAAQTGTPLRLTYGRYDVGVRQEKIRYGTRDITITEWYPAETTNQPALGLSDYFVLGGIKRDPDFDSTVTNIICGPCRTGNGVLQQILNSKAIAKKDAVPIDHKFPAITWSNRHGTVYYQFAMCEYLASHGYTVFVASRVHPQLPLPWDVDSLGRMGLLAEHNADVDAMLKRIKSYTNVDTTRQALFSWSYGGESAIITQQDHPAIDLVVGFSSVNFKRPYFLAGKIDDHLQPEKLAVPYLLFYEDTNRFGARFTTDILHPVHLNKSKLIQFPGLIHGNFNYTEGYLPSLFGLEASHPWANRGNAAMRGYEAVCRLTLLYLQFYFDKKDDRFVDGEIRRIRTEIPVDFIQTKK